MSIGRSVDVVFKLLLRPFRLGPLTPVEFFCQRRAYLAEDAHRLGGRVVGTLKHLTKELMGVGALNATVYVN